MSVYKDELRLSLIFIHGLADDHTHCAAKAHGYLAGVRDRLGWSVTLNRIEGVCSVCGKRVDVGGDGKVRSHYPHDARFSFDAREGRYCRGSARASALAGHKR